MTDKIQSRMLAAVVPAKGARWQLQEVPVPKLLPTQVLVKVCASGISYTDVEQTRGELPGHFPRILGHEVAGEVVAVGDAVTTRRVGDRVGVPYLQSGCGRCEWCLRGRPIMCPNAQAISAQWNGGHAQYMVAAAEAAMLLPEALAYVDAAPILGAGNTVWGGLKRAAPQPAQTVAVVGIGGLGHMAVQYARVAGFRTIAVSRTRAKDEFIREGLKADAVARDGDDLARLGGADVVLATGTSTEAMIDGMCGMRPDSTLVVMGYEVKPLAIPMGDLIMKRIRIVGSRQNTREDLYEALQIVARGSVKVFTERFAFEDVLTVYDRVVAGDIRYRAVLEF